MGVKVLKVLIILDEGGFLSCQEIGSRLNLTPHDVMAQIKMLKRLGMVEVQPRTKRQGENIPAQYRSKRFDTPKGVSSPLKQDLD